MFFDFQSSADLSNDALAAHSDHAGFRPVNGPFSARRALPRCAITRHSRSRAEQPAPIGQTSVSPRKPQSHGSAPRWAGREGNCSGQKKTEAVYADQREATTLYPAFRGGPWCAIGRFMAHIADRLSREDCRWGRSCRSKNLESARFMTALL